MVLGRGKKPPKIHHDEIVFSFALIEHFSSKLIQQNEEFQMWQIVQGSDVHVSMSQEHVLIIAYHRQPLRGLNDQLEHVGEW